MACAYGLALTVAAPTAQSVFEPVPTGCRVLRKSPVEFLTTVSVTVLPLAAEAFAGGARGGTDPSGAFASGWEVGFTWEPALRRAVWGCRSGCPPPGRRDVPPG